MNAQFVASFFIMLRKRHITKKECFVRYFSADFDNHFLSQKNIYDKLRKQIVFCREQINIMIIYIYAEKSNTGQSLILCKPQIRLQNDNIIYVVFVV